MSRRVESEKKVATRKFSVLSDLISDKANALEQNDSRNSEALIVSVDKIGLNPKQPRKKLNEDRDEELVENIREHGVLEPLIVREVREGQYEIVAGQRRYLAAKAAGKTTVPVIVKDYDDKQAQLVSVIENLQRLDLDPLDEAHYFKFLSDQYNYSYRDIARMVHRSHGYVNDRMKRLGLGDKDVSDKGNKRSENGQSLHNSQKGPGLEAKENYNIRPLLSINSWIERTANNLGKLRVDEAVLLRTQVAEIRVKLAALEEMLPDEEKGKRMIEEQWSEA